MAPLKRKGDHAELEVARDLIRRGYRVAFPYGEDWDFDLIFSRDGATLERVQVKHTTSDGRVILLQARSASLTNGKIRRRKHYTAATIDWLAAYDRTSDRCYYVHAAELGDGMNVLSLRLAPPLNSQRVGIRYAEDYTDPVPPRQSDLMEPAGFEPATSWLPAKRSPS